MLAFRRRLLREDAHRSAALARGDDISRLNAEILVSAGRISSLTQVRTSQTEIAAPLAMFLLLYGKSVWPSHIFVNLPLAQFMAALEHSVNVTVNVPVAQAAGHAPVAVMLALTHWQFRPIELLGLNLWRWYSFWIIRHQQRGAGHEEGDQAGDEEEHPEESDEDIEENDDVYADVDPPQQQRAEKRPRQAGATMQPSHIQP